MTLCVYLNYSLSNFRKIEQWKRKTDGEKKGEEWKKKERKSAKKEKKILS